MLREPLSRRNLLNLRAAIKGYSAESVALRKKKAKKTKALDKNQLAMDRCYLGDNIRSYQLAYAFLKGLDYKTVEKSTITVFTSQHHQKIYDIMKLFAPWTAMYMKPEDVKDWIVDGKRFFLTKEEVSAKIQARNAKRKEAQRQC